MHTYANAIRSLLLHQVAESHQSFLGDFMYILVDNLNTTFSNFCSYKTTSPFKLRPSTILWVVVCLFPLLASTPRRPSHHNMPSCRTDICRNVFFRSVMRSQPYAEEVKESSSGVLLHLISQFSKKSEIT